VRLTVYIPRELKLWLQHRSIDVSQDMGQLVARALGSMRQKLEK
jgi:hypothetical protein